MIERTRQGLAGLLHLSRERCLACGGWINVTRFSDMLRLVDRRGISTGFLSCLIFDLHFYFGAGYVRNIVGTRTAIVGSDCKTGFDEIFCVYGSGREGKRIFLTRYLDDR